MCRHLAYLGPPVRLRSLLVDAPHGLVEQARRPRLQTSGHANPDGYGVAWYEPDGGAPRRHRSATPIWADPELPSLAEHVDATAVLAAVRLASPGSPVEETGNAPFVAEEFAWSLNGVVDGWHNGVGEELRRRISPGRAAGIAGVTDGRHLVATAYGNSLFTRADDQSVTVASEPLDDDPGWTRVPDRSFLTAEARHGVTTSPL